MFDVKKLFQDLLLPDTTTPAKRERGIQYATAALLLEVAKADFAEDDKERTMAMELLRETFDLDEDRLQSVIEMAESGTEAATDVYQFTQLVNEHYHHEDKIRLIENLWRVAYADGRLDRYEEQFIRKVAGLLYVAHGDFIKAKLDVLATLEKDRS